MALMGGCFGSLASRLADKEAYPIIAEKQREALGHEMEGFNIDPVQSDLTREIIKGAGEADDQFSTSGLKLNLADALALALDNSRDFQTRKENLYLSALSLTEARHDFDPVFSGEIEATRSRTPSGTVVERLGEATSDFAITQLLPTGARITVGLGQSFSRFYSGTPRESTSGSLSASLTQPLLRGAGSTVVMENLTQAERDTIYGVRSFERYRTGFVIDQVSAYFRILQAIDEVDNERSSYERLIMARERAEALQEAEQMAGYEVDQARQDEISARERWLQSRTDYANDLDNYKLDLGLSTRLNIQPDPAELKKLREDGLVQVNVTMREAEDFALAHRYDYQTSLDEVEDAERAITIAENSLLPYLDFEADYGLDDSGHNAPLDFDGRSRTYSGGLSLELPLDLKGERNDYRRAEIAFNHAVRNADQLKNEIIQEVRLAYQDMEQASQSYLIQNQSLDLAERRVDNVRMLIAAGRDGVTMRDQLDAESDLRDAQNELTSVLVDYLTARLELYQAMESLQIDERGQWEEPKHENE